MQKFPEALTGSWNDACREKDHPCTKEKFLLISASTIAQKRCSFTQTLAANTWLIKFSSLTPCLLLASRNQQFKDAEFGRINHRKRQMNFNALFGRNECSQLVQEDIPRYRVTVWKPKIRLKFKRHLLYSSPSFSSLQPSQTRRRQWIKMKSRRKPTESDI